MQYVNRWRQLVSVANLHPHFYICINLYCIVFLNQRYLISVSDECFSMKEVNERIETQRDIFFEMHMNRVQMNYLKIIPPLAFKYQN